jgi:hypothetical protein
MEEEKENLVENSKQNTAKQKAVKWKPWVWTVYVKRTSKDDFFSSIGKFLDPDPDDPFQEAYLTRIAKCPFDLDHIGQKYPIVESPYTGPLLIDDPATLADYGLKDCKVAKLKIINGKVVDVKPVA